MRRDISDGDVELSDAHLGRSVADDRMYGVVRILPHLAENACHSSGTCMCILKGCFFDCMLFSASINESFSAKEWSN